MKRLAALAFCILLLLDMAGCSAYPQTAISGSARSTESFEPESRTIYSNTWVTEYNGLVYFTANNNIYSYDGKTCKAEMSGSPHSPLFFYFDGGRLLYVAQSQPAIFMRYFANLSDNSAEKAFGSLRKDQSRYHYLFLAAEGHVFYEGNDGKLHRATTDGKLDTVIGDIDMDHLMYLAYSNGYLYSSEIENPSSASSTLYRMRTDGTELKKLPKEPDDGFFISQQGNLYIVRGCTYLQVDDNGTVIKNLGTFSYYGTAGIDDSYIYWSQYSGEGDQCALLRAPQGGGDVETIYTVRTHANQDRDYPPVLVGDYFYFSMDRMLYRIKNDGTELTDIGVTLTSKSMH